MRGLPLLLTVAGAEIAALLPTATYPALTPFFRAEWGLSNAEAGWIGGVYYLGYMLAAPFLISLTDRVDARRVLAAGCLISALAEFGFALTAQGTISASFWRAIAGAGLAGVYMPGLRALTDRIGAGDQSRAITFYTASFSLGVAGSFLLTGAVTAAGGWRAAFVAAALGPLAALALTQILLRPAAPPDHGATRALLDFRPVLRNTQAMAYILGYAAHCFELLALRGWMTAFLVFAARDGGHAGISAASIAALVTALGVPASLIGNEFALRFGRRRTVIVIMTGSGLFAIFVGLSSGLAYWLAVAFVIVYGMTITADSGAITAGTVAAAEPRHLGGTMALHSTLGFGMSFLGPLLVGVALDVAGGDSVAGWTAAFAVMGLGALAGPLALVRLGRR